jgi:hypothetical protein
MYIGGSYPGGFTNCTYPIMTGVFVYKTKDYIHIVCGPPKIREIGLLA